MSTSPTPTGVQAARFEKDAQLQLFGIDSSSRPTPTRFPKTFNPAAAMVWRQILESQEYADFCKTHTLASEMWQYCVKAYLKACATESIYPFGGRSDFEELTRSFLTSARKKLVRWFKESGILEVTKVRKVSRSCEFTHQNFVLEVVAELRPIDDPTFERWLVKHPQPGFKKVEGMYQRSLAAHIDVFYYVSRNTSYLKYRIFCHTPVRVLEPGHLGKSKLTQYVEKKLWNPIIEAQPLEGTSNRRY